jgi:RNA polymerase sigma-70 factor (ECF subfamily)
MTQITRTIAGFSYDPNRGRFRDWLGTVTRTHLLRHLKAHARAGHAGRAQTEELLNQIEAPESDTLWTEAFQARVLEVALKRARPAFEDATWSLFQGSWMDGKPAPVLASALGVPVESVYVAKSRVLKRLREEVALLAEDYPLSLSARE